MNHKQTEDPLVEQAYIQPPSNHLSLGTEDCSLQSEN